MSKTRGRRLQPPLYCNHPKPSGQRLSNALYPFVTFCVAFLYMIVLLHAFSRHNNIARCQVTRVPVINNIVASDGIFLLTLQWQLQTSPMDWDELIIANFLAKWNFPTNFLATTSVLGNERLNETTKFLTCKVYARTRTNIPFAFCIRGWFAHCYIIKQLS